MKNWKKSTWVMLSIVLCMVLLNGIAWCSRGFSDWYARQVFPAVSQVLSHVFGWTDLSFGELMIGVGIFLVVALPVSYLVLMLKKKDCRRKITYCYGKIVDWILIFILCTETMNCFLLYHATPLAEYHEEVYTGQDLLALYVDLAERANVLAPQVQRDAAGKFVLQDDLYETAAEAMNGLGEIYPQFRGYYPQPKRIRASYLMSQMNLTGIYLPFSLEANYNGHMMDINLPDTICHEYSHLRGQILEDEAGFMAYLACTGSDSVDFQYSGIVTALEYVQNAVYVRDITGKDQALAVLSEDVKQDMFVFLPDNYWEEKEDAFPAVVATDTVREVSSAAMDTSLKWNGVDDGKQSYSRIVTLLLADMKQKEEKS